MNRILSRRPGGLGGAPRRDPSRRRSRSLHGACAPVAHGRCPFPMRLSGGRPPRATPESRALFGHAAEIPLEIGLEVCLKSPPCAIGLGLFIAGSFIAVTIYVYANANPSLVRPRPPMTMAAPTNAMSVMSVGRSATPSIFVAAAVSGGMPAAASFSRSVLMSDAGSRTRMTGVFVARHANGDVRVAVTGAGSNGVFRHSGMEAALASNWSPDAIASQSVDASHMMSDIHGSAEYRANLVKVMAKRAVAAAG